MSDCIMGVACNIEFCGLEVWGGGLLSAACNIEFWGLLEVWYVRGLMGCGMLGPDGSHQRARVSRHPRTQLHLPYPP